MEDSNRGSSLAHGARRALVLGFYRRQNYGDELFRRVVATTLSERKPAWDVRFLAPAEADETLGRAFLPRRLRHDRFTAPGPAGALVRAASHLGGSTWSDTLVLGGGSLLEDVPASLRLHLRTRPGRVVVGLGVSVGPFRDDEAASAVGRALGSFRALAVRDRSSVGAARDLGHEPTYCGDLAALHSPAASPRPGAGPTVVLCPGRTTTIAVQDQLDTYESVATELARHHGSTTRCLVLALNNHPVLGDDELAQALAARLRTRGLHPTVSRFADLGITGTWRAIESADQVVSTRLHGAVTAYLTSRPFASLEYHAKCSDFLDDVGQQADRRLPAAGTPGSAGALAAGLLDASRSPGLSAQDYRSRCRTAVASVVDPL